MISLFIVNLILGVICIIVMPNSGVEFEVYWRTFLSGLIGQFAFVFIGLALVSGYAGAVAALVSTQTIWTTVLNTIFYYEYPNGWEISGLIVGFIGTTLISLGPQITKCLGLQKDDE